MKKMREISIACIALMLLLTAVTIPYALADIPTVELTAGGGAGSGHPGEGAGSGVPKSATDVGYMCVWNDCTTLHVKYTVTGDWCLTETHLHVATSLASIPQTKKGNPIPGKFTYKDEYDPCVTECTYDIPYTGGTVYIAAHAVVRNLCTCEYETAWAGFDLICDDDNFATGYDFPGKNWATYFTYPVMVHP